MQTIATYDPEPGCPSADPSSNLGRARWVFWSFDPLKMVRRLVSGWLLCKFFCWLGPGNLVPDLDPKKPTRLTYSLEPFEDALSSPSKMQVFLYAYLQVEELVYETVIESLVDQVFCHPSLRLSRTKDTTFRLLTTCYIHAGHPQR